MKMGLAEGFMAKPIFIPRSHPFLTRRRSHLRSLHKSKQDDSSQRARSKNGGERQALLDVTNESPVVGLASGCFLQKEKTPSEAAAKYRVLAGRGTPGSGEEVLRGTNLDSDEDVEEGEEENEGLDDLCEGLKKMWMEEEKPKLPEFTGKHTRFVYNSDDEIEAEEAVGESKLVSLSVLVLKGLPVPEGKHLRFQEEDESEE
ncbi:uncharacterized protein LOC141837466 [Curcuma longa]|uniref:uncharacterized protein LOC141837466 n=1 Tax=Curcuma longa TaxID=136217 RepID=UPI003D9E324E